MIVHDWGILEYEEGRKEMESIHKKAVEDNQNHLILTQHPNCFTVGRDAWNKRWSIPVIKTDRGGSITSHTKGQNIYYFCFQAPSPARFFSKIITVFEEFFSSFEKEIYYQKENPGFYIENRKICSLGFRYKNGVSLHGVALNVDVDLSFCSQVDPCDLKGVAPTSMAYEKIYLSADDVNDRIVNKVAEVFDESL